MAEAAEAMVELSVVSVATMWNHPGLPDVLAEGLLSRNNRIDDFATILRNTAGCDEEQLLLPVASHPRVVDALFGVDPSDHLAFELACEALESMANDQEACPLLAARVQEKRFAVPFIRHCWTHDLVSRSSYSQSRAKRHLSDGDSPGMRALIDICNIDDIAGSSDGAFAQLCDIVVAGGGDSRSEFALVQVSAARGANAKKPGIQKQPSSSRL
jgi:hypothetical protein